MRSAWSGIIITMLSLLFSACKKETVSTITPVSADHDASAGYGADQERLSGYFAAQLHIIGEPSPAARYSLSAIALFTDPENFLGQQFNPYTGDEYYYNRLNAIQVGRITLDEYPFLDRYKNGSYQLQVLHSFPADSSIILSVSGTSLYPAFTEAFSHPFPIPTKLYGKCLYFKQSENFRLKKQEVFQYCDSMALSATGMKTVTARPGTDYVQLSKDAVMSFRQVQKDTFYVSTTGINFYNARHNGRHYKYQFCTFVLAKALIVMD